MKWGNINEIQPENKLLYWVLMYVLAPYFENPIDHWLKDIFANGRGLGGDPGWSIEYVSDQPKEGNYHIWADPDMSGIYPDEKFYNIETVHSAIKESLLALVDVYPNKTGEVKDVIRRYNLSENSG